MAEACASGSGQPALEAETEQPLDEHQAAAARGADELADALGGQSEQPGAAQAALHPGQRQAAGAMLVGGGEEDQAVTLAAACMSSTPIHQCGKAGGRGAQNTLLWRPGGRAPASLPPLSPL